MNEFVQFVIGMTIAGAIGNIAGLIIGLSFYKLGQYLKTKKGANS
ncbi:hypothetical protein [Alteromonas confluentis]|nr:hypothetical protein [Alteromonas confluentis]